MLDDVVKILGDNNLGTLFQRHVNVDWPIFINRPPKGNHTCMVLRHVRGGRPEPRWLIDYPSFAVDVLAKPHKYAEAEAQVDKVFKLFHSFESADVLGSRWVSCLAQNQPVYDGIDDSNWVMFSIVFDAIIEPAESSLDNRVPL